MDTKALAKSKRAHTQHHSKKSHSVHKPKGPGVVSDNSKNQEKLQGNQTAALKTKSPVQSRRVSALPSNWDRYDDELDLGLENASGDLSTSQPADAIVPKSKGADYLHLISEAQAESQSKIEINSDCLSSLDDLLHGMDVVVIESLKLHFVLDSYLWNLADEFSRVVGSMISARGEGLLSWMEDDNFIVEEDGTASNHEPGFLSLDLNALEKMLEKVDLHERLYIEADLLPPELCTSQSKVSSHTSQDVEAVTTRVQQESSGKIDPIVAQGETSVLEAESLDHVKDIQILTDQPDKSSAIEADLDFLLNSFSEEPNPVASGLSTSSQNPSVQRCSSFETELDSLLRSHGGAEPLNKPANPSDQKLNTTGFGDVLDDLLESTSVSTKPHGNQTPSSTKIGKSKVLDEFDSWLDTI